jgi:NitT/TauT family transport system ATP-binding protein
MHQSKENIVLKVDRVCKSFGDLHVLKDVSFAVRRGEFVVLMGSNGCGKTTLLRILGGVLQPDSGAVDVITSGETGKRARFGMIFQRPLLLPWLSIEENVALPCSLNGGHKASTQRLTSLLELAELTDRRKGSPEKLSGGERQKVAILRALMPQPEVLLLDEPFSALDPDAREHLQNYLLNIWAQSSTTIVFVTHDMDEAALLADRIVVLGRRSQGVAASVQDNIPVALPRPRSGCDDESLEGLVLQLRRSLVRRQPL